LTKTFQEILWKFHRFFGCKSLCFHPEYSPFKDLQQVLKLGKSEITLQKRKKVENVLCIVYFTNGVKRVFTAYYNGDHKLIRVGEDMEQDIKQDYHGVDKILQENKYFCNMENFPKSIPKDIFILKCIGVAYLSDFMRTETVMRCTEKQQIKLDKADPLDSPLEVHILDKNEKTMIICEFDSRTAMEFDPSLTHKLVDNERIRNFVTEKRGVITIKMSAAYKRNSLSDIADRVRMGIKTIQAELKLSNKEAEDLEFDHHKWQFNKLGGKGYYLS
jgi:hypothetical protein